MPENYPLPSAHNVAPSQTVPPITSAQPTQALLHRVDSVVEEEPYTIKCICNFSDDDGNTIYCETCDTWQHIECFYPLNTEDAYREDFDHSCHTCKPRPLDIHQAVERQKTRRSMPTAPEVANHAKTKRPPAKSHKKKTKPTDLQISGHANGHDASKHTSTHDHPPPAKKAKISHKSSQSVSSQSAKRSPPHGQARISHQGHPPSPAKTPPDLPLDFELHSYSDGFLSMYNEDGVQLTDTNSFASLQSANNLSSWLQDAKALQEQCDVAYEDVFHEMPQDFNSSQQKLSVRSGKAIDDQHPDLRWQYLVNISPVCKDSPLMELNGQIGLQSEYCDDPDHRFAELCHPLPFVFFHPKLPLYIDTRKEGSRARYVRRSCKPNATIETYIMGKSGARFWIVAECRIGANEQITIPWDFMFPTRNRARMVRLLGLDDDDSLIEGDQEMDRVEYENISTWIYAVLSEYGGCACDLGAGCAFLRFHRTHYAKAQVRQNAPKKKPRKSKSLAVSPTSTGHTANSRAASEGRFEDNNEIDGRSTSSSSRSKPASRDPTPARQGSFDTLGILTEPTDRDKRKVAMVEDSFRRLEAQPSNNKKKKRNSDGTSNASNKSKSRNSASVPVETPGPFPPRQYVDAGTSRSESGSPASALSPGTLQAPRQSDGRPGSVPRTPRLAPDLPRPNYCDASVQTDPLIGQWYTSPSPTPRPRRRIVSLSKKLLDHCHRQRMQEDQYRRRTESVVSESGSTHGSDPHVDTKMSPTIGNESDGKLQPLTADIPMPDAPVISGPKPVIEGNGIKIQSPELRVQLPPVPAFGSTVSSVSNASTPLAASPVLLSPFSAGQSSPFCPPAVNGIATTPSPVKKKLSLSDYTKSRKAAASRPSGATIVKLSDPLTQENQAVATTDITIDSPILDKHGALIPGSIPPAAHTNGSL